MPRQKSPIDKRTRQRLAYHAKKSDPEYRARLARDRDRYLKSKTRAALVATPEYRRRMHEREVRARTKRRTLAPWKLHFHTRKQGAKQRGIPFELTLNWFRDKYAPGVCELTGLPFVSAQAGTRSARAASVDRRDNSKGYTPENCRLILWGLNAAFGTWGESEAVAIMRAYQARGWGLL